MELLRLEGQLPDVCDDVDARQLSGIDVQIVVVGDAARRRR